MESVFKTLPEGIKTHFVRAYSPMDPEFKKLKKGPRVDRRFNPRCYCTTKGRCTKHRPRALRDVEIAISMSHHHAYRRIVRSKDKLAVVTEDDVIILPNLVAILETLCTTNPKVAEQLLSNTPMILFFGGSNNNPGLTKTDPSVFSLKHLRNGIYSNYCYLLNAAGARLLDKRIYPIERPDDSYKRYLIGTNALSCYQIVPSIVAELSSGVNARAVFSRLSKQGTHVALERSMARETGTCVPVLSNTMHEHEREHEHEQVHKPKHALSQDQSHHVKDSDGSAVHEHHHHQHHQHQHQHQHQHHKDSKIRIIPFVAPLSVTSTISSLPKERVIASSHHHSVIRSIGPKTRAKPKSLNIAVPKKANTNKKVAPPRAAQKGKKKRKRKKTRREVRREALQKRMASAGKLKLR